jgi:hypothetical protein
METKNYETILKTISDWPPVYRLRLMQDILKSILLERDLAESPLSVAEATIAYELYRISDAEHLSGAKETEQLLAQLPPQGLAELASFIDFLRFKYPAVEASAPGMAEQETSLNLDDDPILQMMGLADVEPFAHEIDEILYSPS